MGVQRIFNSWVLKEFGMVFKIGVFEFSFDGYLGISQVDEVVNGILGK